MIIFKDLADWYTEAHEANQAYFNEHHSDSPPKKPFDEEHSKKLEREQKNARDLVMGHPDSFTKVRCWMVDVHGGKEDPNMPEEDCKAAIEATLERRHAAVDMRGDLAKRVLEIMQDYNLTDSGQGGGEWHLGCHCTGDEALDLCARLHTVFWQELADLKIKVLRIDWSLRFVEPKTRVLKEA